jgi:hypothetical protein
MVREKILKWCAIVIAAIAVLFGGLWRQERAVVAAYRDESVCWRVIQSEGAACQKVAAGVSSHPKAVVSGEVASEADRERLERRLAEALGDGGLSRILFGVRVQGQ